MSPKSRQAGARHATMQDVARRAGVSSATVSRALSNPGMVRPELAQRVLQAVAELDYHPDQIARSLRKAESRSIGLLVFDITNPFCAEVARGAQSVLAEVGYVTILCDGNHDVERERQSLDVLHENRVSGLILASSAEEATYFEKFSRRRSIPTVLVDSLHSRELDSVRVDNYAGTLHAIAHLASHSYRRIAIIAGSQTSLAGCERLDAYRRAVQMYGLEQHEGYVQPGAFAEAHGYAATLELLKLTPPPQAILASNNTLGIGAFRALKSQNVRIPTEMALMLFDNCPMADLCDPPLTIVAQPEAEIGRTAARLLLRRLEGSTGEAQEILLPPQLILRNSV
jgi:DNA-binding LacI/PurR family transcriptional regulator